MVEPFTMIAAGAAIGGATSKFVEKAWDAGENWVSSYFANHGAKAKEKARVNSLEFLAGLAKKVEDLEKKDQKNKELIENALSHPDFSILLQKAILSSAQTEDKQKHELLARLISDRLTNTSDSIHALTSKLATDAISAMTTNQLKLLALILNLRYVTPLSIPEEIKTQDGFDNYAIEWLKARLNGFLDVKFSSLDLDHLEALSCLTVVRVGSVDLGSVFSGKFKHEKFKFNMAKYDELEVSKQINETWDKGIKLAFLTSVGQLVGVYVSDMIAETNTNLSEEWN